MATKPPVGHVVRRETDSRCATHGNHQPSQMCGQDCKIYFVEIVTTVIDWPPENKDDD